MRSVGVLLLIGVLGGISGCGGSEAREPAHSGTTGDEGDEAQVESDLGSSEGRDDPHATLVVARLNAITVPTVSEWEREVRGVMLSRYDTDGSGKLDLESEARSTR